MYIPCSQHTRNWMEVMQKLNTFQQTKVEEAAEGAQQEGELPTSLCIASASCSSNTEPLFHLLCHVRLGMLELYVIDYFWLIEHTNKSFLI